MNRALYVALGIGIGAALTLGFLIVLESVVSRQRVGKLDHVVDDLREGQIHLGQEAADVLRSIAVDPLRAYSVNSDTYDTIAYFRHDRDQVVLGWDSEDRLWLAAAAISSGYVEIYFVDTDRLQKNLLVPKYRWLEDMD